MPAINSSENFEGVKCFLEVRWKIIYFVLSILTESLLALNQEDTFFSSLFICLNSSPIFSSEINKFLSSTNMTIFQFRCKVEFIHINQEK